MKILKGLLCLMMLVSALYADTHCVNTNPSTGLGTDITPQYCITSPVNGNSSLMEVTWPITRPSDCLVQVELPNTDSSGQIYGIYKYNPTITTSCDVIVDKIASYGGSFGVGVANCSAGPNCLRTDNVHWSSWPFFQSTPQYTPPLPNPNDIFVWTMGFDGATHLYLGHSIGYSMSGFQVSGAQPSSVEYTHIYIDDHECTPSAAGGTCPGVSGIYVQVSCSYFEINNAASNNYYTVINGNNKYSCPNTPIGYKRNRIFVTATSGSLGAHTLKATATALNAANSPMGTATTTYSFTVVNVPTCYQHDTVPCSNATDFSNPPSVAGYNSFLVNYVIDFEALKTANLSSNGMYCNDAWSAFETTFNFCGLSAYGGDGNALRLAKYLGEYSNTWQSNHSYHNGDIIVDSNGNWEVQAITTCTSTNGSHPSWLTTPVKSTSEFTTDNTCKWYNLGSLSVWQAYAKRLGTQLSDFYLAMCCYTVWQEYNLYTDYEVMDSQQESATPATTLNATAVGFTLYPVLNTTGAHSAQKTSNFVDVPIDTMRANPYAGMSWLNYDLMQNSWKLTSTGSFDQIQRWLDIAYDYFDQLEQCDPTIVNSTYPCSVPTYIASPTYDIPLEMKFVSRAKLVAQQVGHTPDPLIDPALGKILGWLYLHEFNQTGTDFSQPYAPWFVPLPLVNLQAQTGLNNIAGGQYAYYWSICGDSCILPGTSVSAKAASQQYFNNALNSPNGGSISGKAESQIYWDFVDQYSIFYHTGWGWSILPSFNTYVGPFADTFEPYNVGEGYPAKPTAINITGTTADIKTYRMQSTTSTGVRIAVCPANPSNGTLFTGSAGTLFDATIGEYVETTHLTGLSSNTCYNFSTIGVRNSLTASSNYDISLSIPQCCYTFTTTGSTQLSCCTPPILPVGTVNVFYTVTIAAHNGRAPYTYSVLSGGVPGLSIDSSTGVFSGTPSQAGLYSPTIKVVDADSNSATKKYVGFLIKSSDSSGDLSVTDTISVSDKVRLQ